MQVCRDALWYGTFTLLILGLPAWTADWAYEGSHGPDHWSSDWPNCGDKRQSPIDIVTSEAVPDTCLEPLTIVNYENITGMKPRLRNNGHTVQVDLSGVDMRIKGAKLPANYRLAQFHFHWGSANDKGSEHTIDGKAHPMEVHLVHYSTEYPGLLDAAAKPEGLAVLGFFFKIVSDDNKAFDEIVNTMDSVRYKGDNVSMKAFSVRNLLPADLSGFYRYPGSLTTPGCYESVLWTVFDQKISISQAQLEKFRSVFKEKAIQSASRTIVDNYRPVQKLHGRVVTTTIGAGSAGLTPPYVINLGAFIAIVTATRWHF